MFSSAVKRDAAATTATAATAAAAVSTASSSTASGASVASSGASGTATGSSTDSPSLPLKLSSSRSDWDPFNDTAAASQKPSVECLKRIRGDLRSLAADPLPGIVLLPDDALVLRMHALVTGPQGTPYENGFFYFILACPVDYPMSPPRVKLMTTGGGSVRFNPNLYANGKVCLSILGTWSGPGWTPTNTLSSVLLSIQSLMSEQPLRNEPGLECDEDVSRVRAYSDMIAFETMRVAVLDNVKRPDCMCPPLREIMLRSFVELMDSYSLTCDKLSRRCDGRSYADPLGRASGVFAFASVHEELLKQHAKVKAELAALDAAAEEEAAST